MTRTRRAKVAASVLSADFARLGDDARAAAEAGADWIHLDVMDGRFVPNITFGAPVIRALRPVVDRPFDVHLMIEEPERYVDDFADAGADVVTVHAEACRHLHRTVQAIRETGAKAGVALNPATPLSAVEHVVGDLDLLLVMTVNPGFGGQKFIPSMIPKVEAARALLDRAGSAADLEVDGGCTPETAPQCVKAGATVVVAGNAIFAHEGDWRERVAALRGP